MVRGMRTTLNIDTELLAAVKQRAAATHRTIGSVVEEALRRMLAEPERATAAVTLPRFDYTGGLRDGVDLYDKDVMDSLLGETSR